MVVLTAVGMYLAACGLHIGSFHSDQDFASMFCSITFIFWFVTGWILFVIIGNLVYKAAFASANFALRYELDKSRSMLKESNEKLTELDQVKNRFFANISHELRTPLTLLLSPLESMMHGGTQQFDGPTRDLLSIMQANGMRLLKLINDLLDLVRLESGRMEVKREPLEMSAFVRGLTGAADQMATAKGVKLETIVQPGLGALMVDRDKLEKTVLNLLFNALKFTPAGGTVTLRVVTQGEQLHITVEDTGVGISAKNLPFVFDRFWQADNSSKRKYQGVGIGLSLVKELTEIQGGVVSVKSQEGKGTTFTVCLPVILAEASAAVTKPEETPVAPVTVPGQTPAAPAVVCNPRSGSRIFIVARNFFPRSTPARNPRRNPRRSKTAASLRCSSLMMSRTCCGFSNLNSPRVTMSSRRSMVCRRLRRPPPRCRTSSCWT